MAISPPSDIKGVVSIFLSIINPLLLLVSALSLLAFFKGLTSFIFKAGDVKGQEEGKNVMRWGLIGLFVMMSVWGILRFFFKDVFGGSLALPLLPH